MRFSLLLCVAVLCVFGGRPLFAWRGHDWNEWKQVTKWQKPDLHTDQAGRADLAPLLMTGKDPATAIDEIRGWEQKRTRIADALQQILGEPTPGLTPPKPEAEVLGEETQPDHIRRHIRIRSEPEDWITAYLLLPKELGDTPRPTMICLHQTVAQGKEEPCGMKGNPELAFAQQLVQRGFVCIAPDVIGFGERIPAGGHPYENSIEFYRRHPKWSFMGKMIWDVSRIIDYLRTLPYVDPLQIGSIGHSHGAYGTLFAAAFEPRIAVAIASCGFTTLRSDPKPDRWSHLTALIPQLGLYLPDVAGIPFDWQEICALIAPRPVFVWYATKDDIFPNTDNLDEMFRDVRGVYGLYGAADDLAWHAFDGAHRFPDDGRAIAYKWLEERLFPVGDLRTIPDKLEAWDARRPLVQRVIRRTIGERPGDPLPLDLKVLGSESLAGYERRLIEYMVDRDDRVRAYLCIPNERSGPLPGVLVLHQTTPEGKREPVGLAGERSLAFAADLTERGYITLAPDSITAGERIDRFGAFDTRGHHQRYPSLSAMGKMLWDSRRALDVLVATDGVDPARIGVIGHSLGAEEALMLAAFDARVRATVASCGYATFEAEKDRLRWARDHWFSYMPKLRPAFQRGDLPHWGWPEVVRLIAPRPLYLHNTRDDEIFTESESAFADAEAARKLWWLYGRADQLANVIKPGRHAVADDTRAVVYTWLDRRLELSP